MRLISDDPLIVDQYVADLERIARRKDVKLKHGK